VGAAVAIWFYLQNKNGSTKTLDLAVPAANGNVNNSSYQDTPKQKDLLHEVSLNDRQTA
jgi:hypothetical protein